MAHIGVDLELDQLVLTRGRDFKWTFENLDEQTPPQPVDFPAGDLFFEISTHGEHNARGHIDIAGANGGSYVLKKGATLGNSIPFDASQNVVRQEIAALVGGSLDDVNCTGYYTPQWIFVVDWNDSMPLSAGVVEAFNAAVTNAFNALSWVTGNFSVWLEGHYESSSFVFRLTHRGSLLEQEIINFVAGTINQIIAAINSALTQVEHFTGEIADISGIYAPLRHFEYEFVNGKAQTPIAPLSVTSSLTGHSPTISVVTDAKGRAPFTIWPFIIDGPNASIKVESDDCDAIPDRTKWQLVFLPQGELAGGDPVARGVVKVQAER